MMEFTLNAIQEISDRNLCLSSNRIVTLEAGLKVCKRPPIINYTALNPSFLEEILPLVARYSASVILLVSDPALPADASQMLAKASILVGAANEAGIPNERIILDPGIYHITGEPGQRHMADIVEFLRTLPGVFEPSVGATAWLANGSAGAPARLRPVIESALLMLMAGLGASSVFLDVLRRENRRSTRLLKIFHNEAVYADGDLSL